MPRCNAPEFFNGKNCQYSTGLYSITPAHHKRENAHSRASFIERDGHLLAYLASVHDCRGCSLKLNCCPKPPQRKVLRSIYEPARDVARTLATTEASARHDPCATASGTTFPTAGVLVMVVRPRVHEPAPVVEEIAELIGGLVALDMGERRLDDW